MALPKGHIQINKMDRARLEEMSLEQLQKEAQRFNMPIQEDRHKLIDDMVNFIERQNVQTRSAKASGGQKHTNKPVSTPPSLSPVPGQSWQTTPEIASLITAIANPLQQMQQQILESQQAQQIVLQEMLQALTARNTNPQPAQTEQLPPVQESVTPRSHSSSQPSQRSSLASMSSSHAISLLASQIPEYGGKESENVQLWVQRVDQVARIHKVPEDVTLLAASSRLVNIAKRWYDIGSGPMIESWSGFKEAILKRFTRRILYHVALQKIEERKWNSFKETFLEYAMDKLTLMHNLGLSQESTIHLLISGIGSRSLRELAASLNAESVDIFLDTMHQIASVSLEHDKRSGSDVKSTRTRDSTQKPGNKADVVNKQPEREGIICTYCKTPGHEKDKCFKLRRKEQLAQQQSTSTTVPSSPTSIPVATVTSDEVTSEDSVIAHVQPIGKNIFIQSLALVVSRLNNVECNLRALVDTGSPISFVKLSVFNKFYDNDVNISKIPKLTYRALNGEPVEIVGVVDSSITLKQLDQKLNITLNIIKNDNFYTDLILGRDFLDAHTITAIYNPPKQKLETNERAFPETLLHILACTEDSRAINRFDEIETDFGPECTKALKNLLLDIDSEIMRIHDDNYRVQVRLKDDSIYAYAPRRFAHVEKTQIRDITDDLLSRGIIKRSDSPYCARIVPVRKKSGHLRLCVDLRPLNQRVEKQKYPFPIIEDCIALLGNKTVFTLLDLRDGFHQIKVDERHTKYFSFATHEGQYEYTSLPFGYCEAPAEFQKRLVNILSTFINENKVIVYIDDIMIATDTVEENVKTLRKVLQTLKRYGFELNVSKCKFLRKQVEYLGYVISNTGITISKRHTDAIERFPQPRNVLEVQRFLGLTNFFRKFIKDFSIKSAPIRQLLRKTVDFDFDIHCIKAFQSLKSELTSQPILALYNPAAETQLHTDASALGLGGILLQKQKKR